MYAAMTDNFRLARVMRWLLRSFPIGPGHFYLPFFFRSCPMVANFVVVKKSCRAICLYQKDASIV